jgi:hypothetical protein
MGGLTSICGINDPALPLYAMAEASGRDRGKVGGKGVFGSSSAVAVAGGKGAGCWTGEDEAEGNLELEHEDELRRLYEHLPPSIDITPNSVGPFGVRKFPLPAMRTPHPCSYKT